MGRVPGCVGGATRPRDRLDFPENAAAVRAGDGRDVFVAVMVVLAAVTAFGVPVRRRDVGDAERVARLLQRFGTAAVRENAEVADALHSRRQDMHEEAVDERLGGERDRAVAGLALSRPLRLPAADADMGAVEGEDPAVPDADPVGVAREVREHLLRGPRNGRLA